MGKSVLIVEDELNTRKTYREALGNAGWQIHETGDGKGALAALESGTLFDILLLDLRLPGEMDGFAVLDRARELGIQVPPVFIISAYLDPAAWRRVLDLRIEALLPKPVDVDILVEILEAFCEKNETALVNIPGIREEPDLTLRVFRTQDKTTYLYRRRSRSDLNQIESGHFISLEEPLSEEVKRREDALVAEFKARAERPVEVEASEPVLVVGRRWNSWYPSYYDVEGGAYAVIGVKSKGGSVPGALIDPGFKALRVLDSLGVPLGCLHSCLITHNHPDHIGGVFEYMSGRHVLGHSTHIHCSPPVYDILHSYAGTRLGVGLFDSQDVDLIGPYTVADGKQSCLRATPLATSHLNIGEAGDTRGIVLSCVENRPKADEKTLSTAVLLGDTEYKSLPHPSDVFEKMRRAIHRPDLKLVVLHIGCSELKVGTGKHLYLKGLVAVLRELEYWRSTHFADAGENPLTVLISEWGLEHAAARQLRHALPRDRSGALEHIFGEESLVIKTIRILNDWHHFETVTLIPADVGLTVGLESGGIYIEGVGPYRPDEVMFECGEVGLTYSVKAASKEAGSSH